MAKKKGKRVNTGGVTGSGHDFAANRKVKLKVASFSRNIYREQKQLLVKGESLKERFAALSQEHKQHITNLDDLEERIKDHCKAEIAAQLAEERAEKFAATSTAAEACQDVTQRAKERRKPVSPAEESVEETVAKEGTPIQTGATGHRNTFKPRNGELNSAGQSRCVLMLRWCKTAIARMTR